jgi:hypothetical protein
MTTTCFACGHEIELGEFPFCPHGRLREANARRFDSIVIWQANRDPDQYSFPGQADEPCPEGYHAVELSDLHSADKFVARMNQLELEKAEVTRDLSYQALDEQTRRRRADIAARISGNARAEALFRQVREYTDRSRERKRARHARLDPRFHIQVLSYDSGNRNSYSGPETGWRERKS